MQKNLSTICPKDMSNAPEPESYAVWAEDNVRRDSSSGGFFTVLARSVFAQGGVVCGVVMDEDFKVFHTVATNEKEFVPMRGSKYVQSDLRDIFPKVKEFLGKGKKVLFTGTPCQVAGLKAYLGGEEENLLTVDLMCHGAPSEKVFERYVDETFGKENLKEFHFRTKRYGYNCTTCEAVFKNGKKYVGGIEFDPFVLGFTRSLFLRRTCESCKYASFPRQGDLTMGDFWGISLYKRDLNDGRGTSLVLANNAKGAAVLESVKDSVKRMRKRRWKLLSRKTVLVRKCRFIPREEDFLKCLITQACIKRLNIVWKAVMM